MKPVRIKMAHQLIVNYGLYRKMDVYEPHSATIDELTNFHSKDYVNYLQSVSLKKDEMLTQKQYNIGETDCPVFNGMIDFSEISSGGSIDGAKLINREETDIAINWAGGLHHAKKIEACGFCYVNDIVLGILELLKVHNRVLYIDIDVHHGDGVEEAFYLSNRVFTLSFHRFGDFFPGTGSIVDVGEDEGKYYTMNVPLKKGIDDESYLRIYKIITSNVIEYYRPSVIVFQSGADSLSFDKLGDFCLTVKGHGECLSYVQRYNLPILLLGGGGYTVENVARCWTYETAIALNETISNDLPITDFYSKYASADYKLHFKAADKENLNKEQYLNELISFSLEGLKNIEFAPNINYDFKILNDDEDIKSKLVNIKENPLEFI